MDHAAYSLLRSSADLSCYFYGLGHWWTTRCSASRGFDLPSLWQEMVSSSLSCLLLNCNNHRTLRRGKHRLFLWPGVEADGSIDTTTPSKLDTPDEMGKLEKVTTISRSPRTLCSSIVPSSLLRYTNEEIFRNLTGWTRWRLERWRKYMQ